MDDAASEVRVARSGAGNDIVVLTIDNPPANALTPAVRKALLAALADAGSARAVVIRAEGRNFSTAAPPAPPAPDATDTATPSLADLCRAVEGFARSVVVALQGAVVGPGAELALAAHARVAHSGARLVFPDVRSGLVSSAGATQRLPRLVGTAEALEILVGARPTSAIEALAIGLVDVLAEADLGAAAEAHAAAMPGPRPTAARTDGFSTAEAHAAAIAAARAAARRGILPAPPRIIDCIEAALYLPFENGLAMEAVARADLSETPESQGLMASARAEGRALLLPLEVTQAKLAPLSHLGLCGGGPALVALALSALGHGLRVTWFDEDRDRLAAAVEALAARQEEEVRARRLTPVQRDADRARLLAAAGPDALAAAEVIVHGGPGSARSEVAQRLASVPQLVLGAAEGLMGLALTPSGLACELALPDRARPDSVAAAVQVLRRMALAPLLVNRSPIVGRRVWGAGRAALVRLLALGVSRRVLASALDGFGHVLPALPDPDPPPAALRPMTETEVIRRWLAAMLNEGLRLVDAGIARRPSDVDFLLVAGYGFPAWRGGPMHLADQRGLMVVRAEMHDWQGDDPLWAPAPVIDRLISQGQHLRDLDDRP
ncbi:enoyl-CoA hydratase/isomerase family protein [Rhodobacter sp. Har01]|uniref:enoyl-CoA hydratase-related protein n=1 Tax=Rhodobacter sp. Har01 TaxID=2883999 RepID=UPI001D0746CB|nr:enoyl-CoA hydratase-related protein [Rhodobacter sp. Har01]MCB6177545.1 enoyl-CoA hydratase/isomerase family protein [Rhodobacter sp. Har01]